MLTSTDGAATAKMKNMFVVNKTNHIENIKYLWQPLNVNMLWNIQVITRWTLIRDSDKMISDYKKRISVIIKY